MNSLVHRRNKLNLSIPTKTLLAFLISAALICVIAADGKAGNYVVHINFGIGIFRGLTKRMEQGVEKEYLYVEYQAPDGVRLVAYVIGPCEGASSVVLAFHGNADLARWLVPWAARAARETGACVVLPEYRGYDEVGGTPTYQNVAQDAVAAVSYVRDILRVSPDRII